LLYSPSSKKSASKTAVWDENGRLSPLTLQAMEIKGVLARELEPIEMPNEDTPVNQLRYEFKESKRRELERQVLQERNKLAALESAHSGSKDVTKEALRCVFLRFTASDGASNMKQGSGHAESMDLNEFMECLSAIRLMPALLSVDDAAALFRMHGGREESLSFNSFYETIRPFFKSCAAEQGDVVGANASAEMRQYGKSVEAEIAKTRMAIENAKRVEEKRMSIEFQQDINNRDRKVEIRTKIQRRSAPRIQCLHILSPSTH
jgi:hypothetical protein